MFSSTLPFQSNGKMAIKAVMAINTPSTVIAISDRTLLVRSISLSSCQADGHYLLLQRANSLVLVRLGNREPLKIGIAQEFGKASIEQEDFELYVLLRGLLWLREGPL